MKKQNNILKTIRDFCKKYSIYCKLFFKFLKKAASPGSKFYNLLSIPLFINIIMIGLIIIYKKYNASLNIVLIIFTLIITIIQLSCMFFKIKIKLIYTVIPLLFIYLLYMRISFLEHSYKDFMATYTQMKSLFGTISSFPVIKYNKYTEIQFKVEGYKNDENSDYIKTKAFYVIVKIRNSTSSSLKKGDRLTVDNNIRLPQQQFNHFEYRNYLYYHQIFGIILTDYKNIHLINNRIKSPLIQNILINTIWQAREKLLEALKKNMSRNTYAFILSFFFGNSTEMSEETINNFKDTGMLHLMAISGFNLEFIAMIIMKLTNRFLSRSKSLFISLFILLIFILIITPSASSLRAFIMYSINTIFFISGIITSGITVLALTLIITLFINPFYLFDLGFQFSFLATAGILLFSDIITEKLPYKLPDKIKTLCSVTLSAFLSTFLLQWSQFQTVSFISLLTSLFIIPLFSLVYMILFFSIIIFYYFPWNVLQLIIEMTINFFLKVIHLCTVIKPMNLPAINEKWPYIFLLIMVTYFYLIEPCLIKIVHKKQIYKITRLIHKKM